MKAVTIKWCSFLGIDLGNVGAEADRFLLKSPIVSRDDQTMIDLLAVINALIFVDQMR